ncbi:MAG: hypothetical protein GC160_02805 [Acidobacteria bacterium]|nr:hypothetical protein [Acidobacteriota bacterium]
MHRCLGCGEPVVLDESVLLERGRVCRECVQRVCLGASKALQRPAMDAGGLAGAFRRLQRDGVLRTLGALVLLALLPLGLAAQGLPAQEPADGLAGIVYAPPTFGIAVSESCDGICEAPLVEWAQGTRTIRITPTALRMKIQVAESINNLAVLYEIEPYYDELGRLALRLREVQPGEPEGGLLP